MWEPQSNVPPGVPDFETIVPTLVSHEDGSMVRHCQINTRKNCEAWMSDVSETRRRLVEAVMKSETRSRAEAELHQWIRESTARSSAEKVIYAALSKWTNQQVTENSGDPKW